MGVEVGHGERVDDGFFQFGDYACEAADVVEGDGDVVRGNDVHGDGRFVFIEDEVFFAGAAVVGVCIGEVVIVVGGRRAVEASEDGGSGGAFGFGLFVCEGLVGFDAGQGVADKVVDGNVLGSRNIG